LFDAAGGLYHDSDPLKEMKRRSHILDVVIGGDSVNRMPQAPNDPLTDDEVDAFREWFRSGYSK
jgi:hypothetical protein